jgi:acetate kinase
VILVINSGSSTLKYGLFDPGSWQMVARGLVEEAGARVERVLADLAGQAAVRSVGHRVVHGGARFTQPTVIDDAVLQELRSLVPLAPLHNPPAIAGIEEARRLLPDVPQVAVFDTAFHASLPPAAYTYALPVEVASVHGIRRYGFHGISCAYVSRRTASLLAAAVEDLNIIVLHLGNGASATAIQGGRSVATSMGFTPLEGLVMGTRAGDLDPSVVLFLQREAGMSADEVDDLLQHRSGLRGLAGHFDVRSVLEARAGGDAAAALAIDVYCHRIRSYVGAYHAVLGRLDAIVFTAGVGEHAAAIRTQSLAGLEPWGIAVDESRNNASGDAAALISPPDARVAVCVVPTDEETAISEEVATLLSREARSREPRE